MHFDHKAYGERIKRLRITSYRSTRVCAIRKRI